MSRNPDVNPYETPKVSHERVSLGCTSIRPNVATELIERTGYRAQGLKAKERYIAPELWLITFLRINEAI